MEKSIQTMKSSSGTSAGGNGSFNEILLIADPYLIYSFKTDICSGHHTLTTARTGEEALQQARSRSFDLAFIAPQAMDEDPVRLAKALKETAPGLPVILLAAPTLGTRLPAPPHIDHTFIWSGTGEMFQAMVKLVEDTNTEPLENDRACLVVEDSVHYASTLLPAVYHALAAPTDSNPPRLLMAQTHEQAMAMADKWDTRLMVLLSDTRLPRDGREDPHAGLHILSAMGDRHPDLPRLLMSAEPENKDRAAAIGVPFLDKSRPGLCRRIQDFIRAHGRTPSCDKADYTPRVHHAGRAAFTCIGQGSMGGKARGLAFMAHCLDAHPELADTYPEMDLDIPETLVLCTDIFDAFVRENRLSAFARDNQPLLPLVQAFIDAPLPRELTRQLEALLERTTEPLAVRSSSLLEDALSQPYAGLYKTYMIPNNHTDPKVRLAHLTTAVKLVFASTYYKEARTFCRNTTVAPFEDTMAVMIQAVSGRRYGDFFYPTLSGTAQSVNFYPFAGVKAEDGVMNLALGLGHTLAQGEQSFRVSPQHPGVTPQFAHTRDFLQKTQNQFYALRTRNYPEELRFGICSNLERRDLVQAHEEAPVKALTSTYLPADDRIRDTWYCQGPKVLTFAQILKFNSPRLAPLVTDLLQLLEGEMGAPVEIEFAANVPEQGKGKWEITLLQVRPMVKPMDRSAITYKDLDAAVCISTAALGNGTLDTIQDIVYVKPDAFKGDKTRDMAHEISRINAELTRHNRRFLLAGPGRWGSSDPWLGIPVDWSQISNAGAIVEIQSKAIHADPSRGSHFFNTITAQGIPYITVNETWEASGDMLDLQRLGDAETVRDEAFIRHLRLSRPLVIKIDGKQSRCVIVGAQGKDNTTQAA